MAEKSTGIRREPVRLLICGVEGVGKTTLASKCPKPIFFDVENGSGQLDVDRISGFADWLDLITELVKECSDTEHETVVIDTIDAAEKLLIEKFLKESKVLAVEDIPYGKGYSMLADQFLELARVLNRLRDVGKHVVLICHVRIGTITLPDAMGSYSSYALKMQSKQIASYCKEWVDCMLFCRFHQTTVKDGTVNKVVSAKRVMETQHGNGWEAKNRYGLAPQLPMEWESIAPVFGAETYLSQVKALLRGEDKARIVEMARANGANRPSEITEDIARRIIETMQEEKQ